MDIKQDNISNILSISMIPVLITYSVFIVEPSLMNVIASFAGLFSGYKLSCIADVQR